MFRDLVLRNRSYRRFHENELVTIETLRELLDLARFTPSAGNVQPLKYALSCTPEKNARIFPLLAWAGYLKEWPGPEPGERPSAYIMILGDKQVAPSFGCDHGIAAQTLLLGATEKGLGGCMIGSIQREELLNVLGLSEDRFEVLLVIALGKPKEKVVLDPIDDSGGFKYWRESNGTHHVPKRALDEIVVG